MGRWIFVGLGGLLLLGLVGRVSVESSRPAERLPDAAGCFERAPESSRSLVQLVEWLSNAQDPGRIAVMDRLRCAVQAEPDLVALLRDPRPDVRAAAAYTLSEFGPEAEAAVPALIEALGDPHPDPRAYAVVALGEIGPAARDAIPALERARADRDARIHTWRVAPCSRSRRAPDPSGAAISACAI